MTSWHAPQSPPSEWANADLEALLDYHGGPGILFRKDGSPASGWFDLPIPMPLPKVCDFLWGDASTKLDQPRARYMVESFCICDKLYWCVVAYGKLIGAPIFREMR